MNPRHLGPLSGAVFLLSTALLPAVELATLRHAANTITSAEIQAHVNVLADDTFEGREAGSRGGAAAAGYLAKQLQSRGLQPLGENGSYFQAFGAGYRNVLARIEGSDPQRKQECILVAAHYDHVGYGNRGNSFGPFGYVHNGADDNASGISGVLEVIAAVQALPSPPQRSLVFAFFDGEEKGLLGSKHWVANPTMPLEHVACMVNCDMIGRLRDDRVEVFGTRSSYGLRRALAESNRLTNLRLAFDWEMKENSDHYSFYAQGVPTLMLHTGLHQDYHRPSDDTHLLNEAGMQEVSRLLFVVACTLADDSRPVRFRQAAYQESRNGKDHLEAPLESPGPRLGVVSRKTSDGEPRLVIETVTPGTPAQRAGLLPGDRWVSFGRQAITDPEQLRLAILTAESPVEIEFLRGEETQPRKLRVALDGAPVRVGVSWREDDAEPGTVILTQVIYGSPAHRAGLAVADRLYEINGESFSDGQVLRNRLRTEPGPLRMLVEREGKFRTALVEVPTASVGTAE